VNGMWTLSALSNPSQSNEPLLAHWGIDPPCAQHTLLVGKGVAAGARAALIARLSLTLVLNAFTSLYCHFAPKKVTVREKELDQFLFDHTSFFICCYTILFPTQFEAKNNLLTAIWDGIACPYRAQGSLWV